MALSVRLGVIGLGRIVARRARLVQEHSHAVLAAGCDLDSTRCAAFSGVPASPDHEGLLSEDLDAVIVSVVNRDAPTIVVDALRSGRHVFCEKPSGRCLADARRLAEAFVQSGGGSGGGCASAAGGGHARIPGDTAVICPPADQADGAERLGHRAGRAVRGRIVHDNDLGGFVH